MSSLHFPGERWGSVEIPHRVRQLMTHDEFRFWTLWSFIGAVSLLDLILVVVFQESILMMEESIPCRLLIALEPDSLSVFIVAKLLGTAASLTILRGIYLRLRPHGLAIASGVAGFQSWLLCYLTLV